jgi:hypothetical protein
VAAFRLSSPPSGTPVRFRNAFPGPSEHILSLNPRVHEKIAVDLSNRSIMIRAPFTLHLHFIHCHPGCI